MKRIRPNPKPKPSPEMEDFLHRATGLMGASALMHLHVTGEVPFPWQSDKKLVKAFIDTSKALCPGKSPSESASHIAKCMLAQVFEGQTKTMRLPFPLCAAWLSMRPGGNIVSLPVNGEIPVIDRETGECTTFHIEINTEGNGTIYRYHDVESNSTLVGREILLHIDGSDCEFKKVK